MKNFSDRIPAFWPEYLLKIKVNIDVGFGQAVFISGDAIGNWKHAQRLHCVSEHEWTINIRRSKLTANSEFKFLIGPHEAGDNPSVAELVWQNGENLKIAAKESYPGMQIDLTLHDFPEAQRRSSCQP